MTLTHPWPWTFVELAEETAKRVENRSWPPPRALLGQYIALHGGKVPSGAKLAEARADALYIHNTILEDETGDPDMTASDLPDSDLLDMCIPGIFAVARLARVVTSSDSPWFFGPFGWELEELVRIEPPVPHIGAQGLWDVQPDTLALVRERYKAARNPQPAPPAYAPPPWLAVQPAMPEVQPAMPEAQPDMPAVDRPALIAELLAVAAERSAYWATTGYEGRKRGLNELTDAELLHERARYGQAVSV